MTFAVCLQVPNHIHFKKREDIWTNFIPQMIFLQSIFGYLVLCILYKWSVDWSTSSTAPTPLLNMLISMFLSPGTVDPDSQLYPMFVGFTSIHCAVYCDGGGQCLCHFFVLVVVNYGEGGRDGGPF